MVVDGGVWTAQADSSTAIKRGSVLYIMVSISLKIISSKTLHQYENLFALEKGGNLPLIQRQQIDKGVVESRLCLILSGKYYQ